MVRLSLWATLFVLIFSSLILGVQVIGHTNPNPLTTLKDYQCTPQPCWHGIYLGKTQIKDARVILQGDSNVNITTISEQKLCWTNLTTNLKGCMFSNTDGFVAAIQVDAQLLLGDIIASFGQPLGVRLCYISTGSFTDTPPMFMDIDFPRGIVVTSGYYHPFMGGQLTPNQLIDYISFNSPTADQIDKYTKLNRYSWQGFRWFGWVANFSGC